MVGRLAITLVTSSIALAACSSSQPAGTFPASQDPLAGANCSLVKPPVEPELMAWDLAQRSQLDKLRRRGVVAVRYEAKGCEVTLELLPDCIGPKDKYVYAPMASADTRVARTVDELLAQLPVGASSLASSLRTNGAVRTDFKLVGAAALPAGSTISEYDLVGTTCKAATHVVSAVYVGGFGVAQEPAAAATNAFSGGADAIVREGHPAICERAATEAIPLDGCSAPLRVALTPLNGAAPPPTCPQNWSYDGKKCVKPLSEVAEDADAGAATPEPAAVFDRATLERVVRVKSAGAKRTCWETAPTALRSISANIATTIDPNGKVIGAEPQLVVAEGSNDTANSVARCIANDVLTWEFPPPGATQSVVLPFHLLRQ